MGAGLLRPCGCKVAINKAVAVDYFAHGERDRVAEDGAGENEGVELAIFAAGINIGRKIAEERLIEFTTGEAGGEDLGVNANGDGAKTVRVELPDQVTGVALPNGEERGHADACEIFFAIDAEVLEEDVAESDA